MRLIQIVLLPLAGIATAAAAAEQVGNWQFEPSTGSSTIVSATTDPAAGFGLSLSCIGGGSGSIHLTFRAPSDMGRAARSNERVVRYRTGDGPQGTVIASYAGTSAVVYGFAASRGGPELVRELARGGPLGVELRGTNGVAQNGTITTEGAAEVLAKVAQACSDDALAALVAQL